MPRLRLRDLVALAALGWLIVAAPAAHAQVEGPCTMAFNGVDVDRIDTISSPLELKADDVLVFHGVDETGTQQARVEVTLMMITVDRATTTYGPLQSEFRVDLDLGAMTPYAVGLFRVRGTTDNCVAEAWLRVSGRVPVATLVGLTAVGVTIGGVAGQLSAIASRRRWAPLVAGVGGIATGIGGAMVGQSFGRLQISFLSLGLSVGAAMVIGALVAWALADRPQRREPEVDGDAGGFHDQPRDHAPAEPGRRQEQEAEEEQASPRSEPALQMARTEPVTRTADTSPNGGPYWCYVMTPTEVLGLEDHDRVVGSLLPGTWYLAKREVGGWVHVVIAEGSEGWVPQSAVHRHG